MDGKFKSEIYNTSENAKCCEENEGKNTEGPGQ
jgi:hypothetical protein